MASSHTITLHGPGQPLDLSYPAETPLPELLDLLAQQMRGRRGARQHVPPLGGQRRRAEAREGGEVRKGEELSGAVLGVDACRGGWVGILLPLTGTPTPTALFAPTVGALVEHARQQADLAVVGIDIPIGLGDEGARAADVLAAATLGARRSSVFATPVSPVTA